MAKAVGTTQLLVSGCQGQPNLRESKRTCRSVVRNFHLQSQLDSLPADCKSQRNPLRNAVYGTVPSETDAPAQVRDMVDMTDAAAQAAMKRAIEIDSLADLELQAAGQITASVQNAAPGSAPILEAQADAWLIRANAYTQEATADLMRRRAVDLADSSAELKIGASYTANLRQGLINLLEHN
jgi:hypothetical protein